MNQDRRKQSLQVRIDAAELAAARPHPAHVANGDEQKFRNKRGTHCSGDKPKDGPNYLTNFTKGLPHDIEKGLVLNASDYEQFVKAIDSGDEADFKATPLGPKGVDTRLYAPQWESKKANEAKSIDSVTDQIVKGPARVRAWESQGAGNTFDLEGPDAQAVTMPPAPELGSEELSAEMAEVYAQALLRDVPFELIQKNVKASDLQSLNDAGLTITASKVSDILKALENCAWFKRTDCCGLTEAERNRMRTIGGDQHYFRGITPGDNDGPYISQFLLLGNAGLTAIDRIHNPSSGYIRYGSIRIDQRVRFATPYEDHMQTWKDWFDVQNGANLSGQESYEDDPQYRFITTPRDLATYVHYDALYEAYL
ncbi:MAG: bromoperoxidase, partial [Verrucomicrobiota bacterium]